MAAKKGGHAAAPVGDGELARERALLQEMDAELRRIEGKREVSATRPGATAAELQDLRR